MVRTTDGPIPVFDRGGGGPLSGADNDPFDVVGGETRDVPADDLTPELAQADNSRPDLPDEDADGLDETNEEILRQAEDLPLDTPGR